VAIVARIERYLHFSRHCSLGLFQKGRAYLQSAAASLMLSQVLAREYATNNSVRTKPLFILITCAEYFERSVQPPSGSLYKISNKVHKRTLPHILNKINSGITEFFRGI
jgi:hypothetical protein